MSRISQPWPPVEVEPATVHPKAPQPGSHLGIHFGECFGCGDEIEAGLHLQSTVGEGTTVYSKFTVTSAHQGAPGLAHGGLLACAFDEALGATVGNLLRRPAVTGKLETDFLRPVPVGSTLYIATKLDGVAGRKIYVSADGRLDAEDGPVAVRARALFVRVEFEHFSTHGDPEALQKLAAAHEKAKREREWDINP
ncbi:PaaI family thioesterase [Amycolatopsis roodepoortensis]|uniref:Acyl-coenzyme A thioesterase THEM4 n=1 Tax=Amycolatopsis roodepoortensis TaxID=700274 RepID=A0ABR9LLU3_9PSEU|nr:PaaI family thioesterase [Amycolatopsis roodepoortensis]MBE1581262.1 acyl-coenzyme A thioesterase PaaI-like protein [Amycolatopsis roodepoortensis]